ncbi:MAG: FAD/NAD(P)-binding oxidoreductase [Clostridia bacterium]|nr:FAD/NAD(P)-binding oxidoreductase [Clostridia bacterium]
MYDVTVIGCGVTGAAIAYQLARYDLRVLVLERENDVAMGATRANSAIVHAGFDPEPGTLMAKLNVRGSARMEALCRDLSVFYRRTGSLVLAFTDEENEQLTHIYENGVANGVPAMRLLDASETLAMEPSVSPAVRGALYAPTAAVVDPWGLCLAMAETAVKNGVELRLRTEVTGVERAGDHLVLHTPRGDVQTRYAVSCAGGHGHTLAARAGDAVWKPLPSRGEYYLMDKSAGNLVNLVIFQCPTAAGKGVLVAPTVHGNLIVGPSAIPAESPEDTKTTGAGLDFVRRSAQKSVPAVDIRACIRTFAGVRANTDRGDFILEPSAHTPGLLHVAGIKSPGLSAAPAIGEYAVELLAGMGLTLHDKLHFDGTRRRVVFRHLSAAEKAARIAENPLYGRIICRCETITEGEIVDAIHSPVPPCSIDGIKRRAGAGMGRCQGGFCGPRVLEILARELKIDPKTIPQDGDGSLLLLQETKQGGAQA